MIQKGWVSPPGNSDAEHRDKGATSSSDRKKDNMQLELDQKDTSDLITNSQTVKMKRVPAGTGTRTSCNAGLQHLPGAGPAAGGNAAAHFGGCFSTHPRVMALQGQMNQMNQTKQWKPSIHVEFKGSCGVMCLVSCVQTRTEQCTL
jgi:hypothetical protein